MTVKMYLFTLVSQGVSMPGMGGQYAPEYPNYILGGCQIDATGLEIAGSFNLKSIVISTKLIKEILKNEGNESVWQQ